MMDDFGNSFSHYVHLDWVDLSWKEIYFFTGAMRGYAMVFPSDNTY